MQFTEDLRSSVLVLNKPKSKLFGPTLGPEVVGTHKSLENEYEVLG